MRDPVLAVGAVGATGRSVEITFDIDSLRNAHRRGDRTTFWLAPILFTCWAAAFWLIFMAGLLAFEVPTAIQILATVFLLLLALLPWFVAWAAVYTNIDLGKAGTGASAGATTPTHAPPEVRRKP